MSAESSKLWRSHCALSLYRDLKEKGTTYGIPIYVAARNESNAERV
jgi:hypothetical protein